MLDTDYLLARGWSHTPVLHPKPCWHHSAFGYDQHALADAIELQLNRDAELLSFLLVRRKIPIGNGWSIDMLPKEGDDL